MQRQVQAELAGVPETSGRDLGSAGPLTIAVCGLSHHTAPIEILEQLAFTPETRAVALQGLVSAGAEWPASEAVILSTCNRVELYIATSSCAAETPDALRSLAGYLAAF